MSMQEPGTVRLGSTAHPEPAQERTVILPPSRQEQPKGVTVTLPEPLSLLTSAGLTAFALFCVLMVIQQHLLASNSGVDLLEGAMLLFFGSVGGCIAYGMLRKPPSS